eukprot:TRINITY_DN12433_c0_g1_i1.p1 TRINITY_DN12433_c0_g1~~TRINITY_DN12433_c0_g1_i1.p1  ORF type:complete len:343 (+),score=136.16 TRINITY_DN12433_c0_g1_i1:361-1389(+)
MMSSRRNLLLLSLAACCCHVSAFLPTHASRTCLAPTSSSTYGRLPMGTSGTSAKSMSQRRAVIRAMFSGIVEEKGTVKSLERNSAIKLWDGSVGEGVELTIAAKVALEGASLGCSIAVNGVCLTVTDFDEEQFRVGLAPETLRRSNLRDLAAGDAVNLERALASGGRNSGHFVQGHVDDVGTIAAFTPEGDSLWVRVSAPRELMRYIVPKGFIAIDGTSLTVCEVNAKEAWFTFMLVAYTQAHIVLPGKAVGDKVNIEVDVLGKYVERSLASVLDRLDALETAQSAAAPPKAEGARAAAAPPAEGSVEYRLGAVEHKVTSRDLVIDSVEARLRTIERKLDIQ